MTPLKDYTGQKYNHLTFVEYKELINNKTYWSFICDCGVELIARSGDVISGHKKSCGCSINENRHKDYSGLKVNNLTFVEYVKSKNRVTYWKFRCDCGNEIVVSVCSVLDGKTHSCGCLRRMGRDAMVTRIFRQYRRGAISRGYNFALTKEQVSELIGSPCFYCGAESSNTFLNEKTNEQFGYNGIDRVNNSIGYEVGNVVPCCRQCNWAKRDLSSSEFISWINRLHSFQEHKSEVEYAVNKLFDLEVKQ